MATQVVNASLGTTPYRVTLGDDSHQWLSDVPAALGGGDSGPRRDIRLAGDLDAEQRQRLLEIANACPIHRVLSGEVSVSSQLRD